MSTYARSASIVASALAFAASALVRAAFAPSTFATVCLLIDFSVPSATAAVAAVITTIAQFDQIGGPLGGL